MSVNKRKYTKTTKEQQILVLQEMLDKKDLLFGQFAGSNRTKEDISLAWKSIVSLAMAYGLTNDPNEERFRRITWQNWRRTAMAKVDRMKKTGVGGATPKDLLDEGDKLILAIVGDDITYGLTEIPQSDGINLDTAPSVPTQRQPQASTSRQQEIRHTKPSSNQRDAKFQKEMEEQKLKVDLLKINYYCKQLESREREINLGLPPSAFTASLYLTEGNDNGVVDADGDGLDEFD